MPITVDLEQSPFLRQLFEAARAGAHRKHNHRAAGQVRGIRAERHGGASPKTLPGGTRRHGRPDRDRALD
jgi:hypothetical protein